MENNWKILTNTLKNYNLSLSDEQLSQFEAYFNFLHEYNQHTNIVSSADEKTVIIKHFIDSISLNILKEKFHLPDNSKIIDIGSGGGFPGVPLIIMNQEWKLCAVDSIGKKTKFIELLAKKLGVDDRVEILTARAEELGQNTAYREKFDIAVSRAVCQLNTLCEYCLPLVKKDGYFIAYKSKLVNEELKQSEKAISIIGGKFIETAPYLLPDEEAVERNLTVIKKIKTTPAQYPRKTGIPKKNPLV